MKSKYKGVYKSTNGKWYFATRIKQEDGSFKSVKSKTFETPIEAYQSLLNLKNGISLDTSQNTTVTTKKPKASISFMQCYEDFIEAYSVKVKTTSLETCKNLCKSKMIPQFKDTSINYLCESRVLVDYMNYLKNCECSNMSRNKIIQYYVQICERAFYNGYISQNEFGLVKLSLIPFNNNSNCKKSSKKKREKYFYTKEEYDLFYSSIDKEDAKICFEMLFFGGFRIGELLALTREDVNEEDNTISVSKAKNIYGEITSPKTKNSTRKVFMPKMVMKHLMEHIEIKQIKASDKLFDVSRTYLVYEAISTCEKAKLEYLNLHGFRHSYVSYVISITKDKGIPFKFLSSQTGDNVNTIMEVYSHIYKSDANEIMQIIENA